MIIGIDIGGTHFRVDAAKRVRTDKKIHPTAAGLLVFGEEFCVYSKLVKDMPYLIVKSSAALKFRWTGTRSAGFRKF